MEHSKIDDVASVKNEDTLYFKSSLKLLGLLYTFQEF